MLILNKMAEELSNKFIMYNHGPEFKTGRIITKKDIVNLCHFLSALDFFKSKGISFRPEQISEGGIEYIFSNNYRRHYKSIRFTKESAYRKFDWPTVTDLWKDSDDPLFSCNEIIPTYLKAFHGAPFFDMAELDVITYAFSEFSIYKLRIFKIIKKLNNIAYGQFTRPFTDSECEKMNNGENISMSI